MSADPRQVERVLKLFALASGTRFAAEATAAREKAEALIAKHNITLPSVKDRNAISFVNYAPNFRGMKWELMLVEAAAQLCGCEVFFKSGEDGELTGNPFALVGTLADLEACQYLLAILNEQRIGAWMTAKADGVADRFHSFCFSFARGVQRNVETRSGDAEAERAKAAYLWWDQRIGGINKVQIHLRGEGRSEAGRSAGETASLHRGALGSAPKRLGYSR